MSSPECNFDLNLDHNSDPLSVLLLRFIDRTAKDRPYGVSFEANQCLSANQMLPSEAIIVSTWQGFDVFTVLAEADTYLVLIHIASNWKTTVRVAAAEQHVANDVSEQIRRRANVVEHDVVDVAVWHARGPGGGFSVRQFATCRWSDIGDNYAGTTRKRLKSLMARGRPDPGEGRLILFHGEPGTGKTTAIRALMSEWSDWCDPHLVTDPDQMFGNAGSLLDVLRAQETTSPPTLESVPVSARWKLVIAEDTDSYLRSNDAGAALGRLLNSTDGLLSQSMPVLVLLTTNEPLTRFHPAITRPGRCLAQIEFERFGVQEAMGWLKGTAKMPPRGATLAELYEFRRSGLLPEPFTPVGTYL